MSLNTKTNGSIPVSPRVSIYFPDGHGRDSYIFSNNGGLSKSGMRVVSSNETLINQNGVRFSNLTRNPAPVKYFCDGSGRDTYVNINSGGFERGDCLQGNIKLNNIVRNQRFKINSNLPEFISPRKNISPFKTKKERDASRDLKNLEIDLINRLFYNDSNSFKLNEPLSPKLRNNGSRMKLSYDFDSELNLYTKKSVNLNNENKKFDYNSFNEYLDKLANYENKKVAANKK